MIVYDEDHSDVDPEAVAIPTGDAMIATGPDSRTSSQIHHNSHDTSLPSFSPARPRTSRREKPHAIRQPVSCAPCRARKIRCSRTSPPCDTCRRRRCEEKCTYTGSISNNPNPTQTRRWEREDIHTGEPTGREEELLERIRRLEEVVHRNRGSNIPARLSQPIEYAPMPTSPELGSCGASISLNAASAEQYSPISTHASSSSATDYINHDGRIGSGNPPGNERNIRVGGRLLTPGSDGAGSEVRSVQWRAALPETTMEEVIHEPSLKKKDISDDEDDSENGFPFLYGPVPTTRELVSLLPPITQCESLKNTYFEVFSPVSLQTLLLPVPLIKAPLTGLPNSSSTSSTIRPSTPIMRVSSKIPPLHRHRGSPSSSLSLRSV